MDLYDKIREAAQAIQAKWRARPRAGIILGTGLGGLVEDIRAEATIPYRDLPHFPESTAPSHASRLVCGQLAGKPVVAMEGRFHFYEGYALEQITFPVRVMKALGCDVLVVSNASGGMNPQYAKGDIMIIEDHINLLGANPLIGPNDDRLGPRFPDMSRPYDRELIALAKQLALEEKVVCHKGVFVAVPGPNLETRAEYRFLRGIGADAVGMSTVPEVTVAVHCGFRTVGFSIITDMCLPDALEPTSLEEIIATANAAEKKLRVLVRRLIGELP
jgi:purine-nucleoside phosphorylase